MHFYTSYISRVGRFVITQRCPAHTETAMVSAEIISTELGFRGRPILNFTNVNNFVPWQICLYPTHQHACLPSFSSEYVDQYLPSSRISLVSYTVPPASWIPRSCQLLSVPPPHRILPSLRGICFLLCTIWSSHSLLTKFGVGEVTFINPCSNFSLWCI